MRPIRNSDDSMIQISRNISRKIGYQDYRELHTYSDQDSNVGVINQLRRLSDIVL